MITPSFALTATERVLPKMALDFTTASLDSRVTFTRSGNTATVTNSSGYVVPINANLPRFDYNPIALTCKGLLIEETKTNVMLQSEALNTVWIPDGATVNTSATTSPANTSNGNLVDGTTGGARIYQILTVAGSTAYTFSIFTKFNDGFIPHIEITTIGGVDPNVNSTLFFNFGTEVASGTCTNLQSVKYANGWYRISGTFTTLTTHNAAYIYVCPGQYYGSINKTYFWGAQTEASPFATSYIPTGASQVTRTADVAVMTGTNFSDWYTATTGAAAVWSIPQSATGVRPLIQFDDATALKIITLRGNTADPELYIVNTTAQAQIDAGTIVANTLYKLSGAWNTNDCAAAKDGGAVGTDVVATIPAPTQLRIGSDGTNYAASWLQKIMYYKQRIINAEVQAFSK